MPSPISGSRGVPVKSVKLPIRKRCDRPEPSSLRTAYSVIGNVSSLAAMGPPSCIGPILTPTRDGSTSSSTASTTSNRMRARFSIDPPVFISATVGGPVQELRDQVEIGGEYLHSV